MSLKEARAKCQGCYHCEPDPEFVDQTSYYKPDNRKNSICEVQDNKKVKSSSPRKCDLFKDRFVMDSDFRPRDIKKFPIGSMYGDVGFKSDII